MLRFLTHSHRPILILSGLIWLGMGIMLCGMGLNFTMAALLQANASLPCPLFCSLAPWVGGKEAAACWFMGGAILVGTVKGQFLLSRTVMRHVLHLSALPLPFSLKHIYPPRQIFLIGIMVLIGMGMRLLPLDVRGVIDIAVGGALLQGAFRYLRVAYRSTLPSTY